jgi:hypothetical protein
MFFAVDTRGNEGVVGNPGRVLLPSGVTVTEVGGVIIIVETLDADVEFTLRLLLP